MIDGKETGNHCLSRVCILLKWHNDNDVGTLWITSFDVSSFGKLALVVVICYFVLMGAAQWQPPIF